MGSRIVSLLISGIRLRCPRCSEGPLYRKPFQMRAHCPHCNLKYEREQGYFVGAIYINYAATIAVAVPGFFLLDAFAGFDIDRQLKIWIPFTLIFPVLFFHHSRSLWLMIEHLLNPPERLYEVPPKKGMK